MEGNCIAFKLNYCNGGSDKNCIGFRGLCSKGVMDYNVKVAKRGWCSHEGNLCRKCLDRKISSEELEKKWYIVDKDDYANDTGLCNESFTLKYWYAEAGWNSDDTPRRINNKNLGGHLCVLTTVKPNMPDSSRFVFAMFVIKDVFDGGDNRPDYVVADNRRLEFYPNEVKNMKFYSAYTGPTWRQGLFRYFDDATAIKFLEMAVKAKHNTPEEDFAKEFLKQYPYK